MSSNRKPSPTSSSSSSSRLSSRPIDPLTRTALRYSLSPREYELLHQYLISRAPARVQKSTPDPKRYERITKAGSENGECNVAALRAALRVFVGVWVGLRGWEVVIERLASRRGGGGGNKGVGEGRGHRYGNVRVALSFSSILLFHQLLGRFFRRLRTSLLEDSAGPFRERNPGVARLLTSQYTPAVGASLAGLCLGIAPADQLRMTIAIYVFTRSLEFGYNALEEGGHLWKKDEDGKPIRPWWFGSWLIMPFACGQLLHAFVFDRECFPESYGRFILQRSPEYIQFRPKSYPPDGKPWPGTFDIVDGLASLSNLRWPPFISPILFPNTKQTLPSSATLSKISPITAPAHPGIKHTSCALLHPSDPSCTRTYLKYWATAFPTIARFFALVYGAFALLAYKSFLKAPAPFLNRISLRILRMSIFITGAIGTSWASICLFSHTLPGNVLPTQRWFLGGFLGGLFAFVARKGERGNFLYSARLSMDSLYKVGKKRGWWKGVRGGDVVVFVASLALLNVVYEKRVDAVRGVMVRKGVSTFRGEGWVDAALKRKKDGVVDEVVEGIEEDKKDV